MLCPISRVMVVDSMGPQVLGSNIWFGFHLMEWIVNTIRKSFATLVTFMSLLHEYCMYWACLAKQVVTAHRWVRLMKALLLQ